MRGFYDFLEALKFTDPRNQQLQNHPYVKDATFGVEIEFIAVAATYDDMKPQWLMSILKNTPFGGNFLLYGENQDFLKYITENKKKAWDYLFEIAPEGQLISPTLYIKQMARYWGDKIDELIESSGFPLSPTIKSYNNMWTVGDDGTDTYYNLPVVEIRSGIMSQKDLPNLLNFFEKFSKLIKENSPAISTAGNTGLHVHVHNPAVAARRNYYDAFARLAVLSSVDEDWIVDQSGGHDRDFETHATLNKPENYSTKKSDGSHDQVVYALEDLIIKNNRNPLFISNEDLGHHLGVGNAFYGFLSRNMGVNVTSEHPTVEYRYLSSTLVVESPRKAVGAVQHFVNNTAQLSNKDRIKFVDSTGKVCILTKLPDDMIRIDLGDVKSPRSGLPRHELDRPVNTAEKRINQPFKQWYYNLSPKDREKLHGRIHK